MQSSESGEISIPLTVVSYTDSAFTNVHDLVSSSANLDGRGTFSHVGVRMEGLESQRHLNFKFQRQQLLRVICAVELILKENEEDPAMWFSRDSTTTNRVVLMVGPAGDTSSNSITRALVSSVLIDTAFYTKNNVRKVYQIEFIDDLEGLHKVVARNVSLKGDDVITLDIDPQHVSRVVLTMTEGGMTRFKLFGKPADKQLPAKKNLLLGARVFGATDASYGDPGLVLRPSREGKVMAGWETCRHSYRQRLGVALPQLLPSSPCLIEVDTYMHCLNAFKAIQVLSCNRPDAGEDFLLSHLPKWRVTWCDKSGAKNSALIPDSEIEAHLSQLEGEDLQFWYRLDVPCSESRPGSDPVWKELLAVSALERDTLHSFQPSSSEIFTHLMIYGIPDGGIHRFAIY